jgi:riboflavin biosynthesis pyrimidine reductase
MEPLRPLYEAPGLPSYELPRVIARLHGGPLGFTRPRLYANFVSSIDGVVALPTVPGSPSVISGKSEADRFMMALLRACAGAVLIGGGTLRAEPEHRWTPGHVFPDASEDFAQLRMQIGLRPEPELYVATATGDIDAGIPALERAVILTTGRGARALEGKLSPHTLLVELGQGPSIDASSVVAAIRSRGNDTILSEGGPVLMSQLVRDRLLDELFLTLSPLLLGRSPAEARPSLVEGVDLLDPSPPWAQLLTVRSSGSHLFLRYSLRTNDGPSTPGSARLEGIKPKVISEIA